MFSEKKSVIIGLLLTLFLIGVIGLYAEFAGGSGTEENPWLIETAEHLNNIRNYEGTQGFDKYFEQIADIDLGVYPWNEGEGWEPIGDKENPFYGHYDGNEFSISNLYINRPELDNVGLFGYCMGAELINVKLQEVDVTGCKWVGGLLGDLSGIEESVGVFSELGKVSNCSVTGRIAGSSRVGGLIGYTIGSTISRSGSCVEVTVNHKDEEYKPMLGGLIGMLSYSADIYDCYARGSVEDNKEDRDHRAGGLIGAVWSEDAIIKNCYTSLESELREFCGYGGEVISCYHDLKLNVTKGAIYRTTEELKYPYAKNTYVDWDFEETWSTDYTHKLNDGFPLHLSTKNVPYNASNPVPNDGEESVFSGVLSWEPTYNEKIDNSPKGFLLSLGTDNPPTNIKYNYDIAGLAQYKIEEQLEYNTTYYWKVIPYNKLGEAEDIPVWSFTTYQTDEGDFAGGFGTEADPWKVQTAEQLNLVRKYVETETHFIQIDNIDLNEEEGWEPIGIYYNYFDDYGSELFNGVYDGNGYHISGLYINNTDVNYIGLFVGVKNGVIKNLYVKDANITGRSAIGGIAGIIGKESRIENCHFSGEITGKSRLGGIVGESRHSLIEKCSNLGNIKGLSVLGGIGGFFVETNLSNSFNLGYIEGEFDIGGLVGGIEPGIDSKCEIIKCYSAGKVSGSAITRPYVGSGAFDYSLSYWDTITVGLDNDFYEIAKTTEEMTYPYGENTYVDWDFDNIWKHDCDHSKNDGYPYLWEEIDLSADKSNVAKPLPMSLRNYPNPFNPETTISFNLPKEGKVELSIYNIKGQLVKKVINRPMDAGQHVISWNGSDVSSGLYFYKLATPESSLINKMMLLK
ncbi:MAG: GLUG motif-containing protein [Candidatus Cloacimonas sp.]|nr:T9SS type A sorting domain-containing protein [Candidatus Cloacimonadota bacterium]